MLLDFVEGVGNFQGCNVLVVITSFEEQSLELVRCNVAFAQFLEVLLLHFILKSLLVAFTFVHSFDDFFSGTVHRKIINGLLTNSFYSSIFPDALEFSVNWSKGDYVKVNESNLLQYFKASAVFVFEVVSVKAFTCNGTLQKQPLVLTRGEGLNTVDARQKSHLSASIRYECLVSIVPFQ